MKCPWCTSQPCSYCRSTPAEDRAALEAINRRFRCEVEALRLARQTAADPCTEGTREGRLARALLDSYTESELRHIDHAAVLAGIA